MEKPTGTCLPRLPSSLHFRPSRSNASFVISMRNAVSPVISIRRLRWSKTLSESSAPNAIRLRPVADRQGSIVISGDGAARRSLAREGPQSGPIAAELLGAVRFLFLFGGPSVHPLIRSGHGRTPGYPKSHARAHGGRD